jgi:autotransporter-associated beta strand protein
MTGGAGATLTLTNAAAATTTITWGTSVARSGRTNSVNTIIAGGGTVVYGTTGGGGFTQSGNITNNSAGTFLITNGASGTVNISGAMSGSGAVTLANSSTGKISLGASNSYAGGTVLSNSGSGSVSFGLGHSAAFGSGTITSAGSGLTNIIQPDADNLNVANNWQLNAGNTLRFAVNNTTNLTASGNMAGDGSLMVGGTNAGTVILSGNNTYAGTTVLTNGATLRLGSATALGATNGGTTVSSGNALDLNGQAIGAEALTISGTGVSSSGVIFNSSASGASWSGNVASTTNSTIKATNGSITLSGRIDLNNTDANSRTLTLDGTGGLILSGIISNSFAGSTGSIAIAATGSNVTLSGSNSYNGTTTLTGGGAMNINSAYAISTNTFVIGSTAFLNNTGGGALTNLGNNNITLGSDLTFGTSGSTATNSLNLGTGTVTASSSRTIAIAGTGVTLGLGTLDSTSTSSGRTFTANGAGNTLSLAGWKIQSGSTANVTATLAGSANWTITGPIVNGNAFSNGVQINATGLTTFGGNNTYDGTTIISSGATLKLGNAGALGSTIGATTVSSGGSLDLSGQAIGAEAITMSGTGVGGNGALYNGTNSTSILAGAVTLAGSSTMKTVAGGSIALSGALDLNASSANTRTLTIDGAGTTTLSGNISNSFAGSTGAIVAAGTGRTILSGNNSYSGTTTVNTNAILVASNSAALGATNTGTTVDDGGTLALQGDINITNESVSITGQGAGGGGALRNLSGINTYGGGITFNTGTNRINSDAGTLTLTALANGLAGTRQLVVGGAGNVVLAAALSGTSINGTVTKEGAGTLTLGNTNTYAGNTFVNGGTLLYGTNDALGAVAVTVDSGTMDIGAYSDTVGAIIVTNGGSILGSGGTLTGTSYSVASSTISANLAGSGGLTVNGTSSTAVLSGSNSYSGATQFGAVTNQTLRATTTNSLSANSTLEGSSSLPNTPTVDLAAGGHTMKNYLGGNVTFLATNGAATLTFTNTGASNTIVGGSRTLTTTNVNLLFEGDLDISATGADKIMTFAGNGNVTVSGAITVTNTSFLATLRQGSSGTTILNGANTYNGGTSITNGVLQIGNGGATGTLGDGVVTNNATLAFNRTGTLAVANMITGTGALTKSGAGTVTLAGADANTYTGRTTINGGVLELNKTAGVNAIASTNITVGSGAKLLLSASDQVANSGGQTVTLSGGTIQRGSGVSETFGNLNVAAASTLNFGSGTAGSLGFGTYSRDTESALLTVQNFFQGNSLVFSQNLVDLGYISSSSTGSFSNGYFAFADGFNTSWNGTDTFTITAIPEPSTYVAAAGLLALFLLPARRRLIKDAKSILGLRPAGRDRIESYRNA